MRLSFFYVSSFPSRSCREIPNTVLSIFHSPTLGSIGSFQIILFIDTWLVVKALTWHLKSEVTLRFEQVVMTNGTLIKHQFGRSRVKVKLLLSPSHFRRQFVFFAFGHRWMILERIEHKKKPVPITELGSVIWVTSWSWLPKSIFLNTAEPTWMGSNKWTGFTASLLLQIVLCYYLDEMGNVTNNRELTALKSFKAIIHYIYPMLLIELKLLSWQIMRVCGIM